MDLTKEYLLSRLDYNEVTGELTWKHQPDMSPRWNNRFSGKTAGCQNYAGYIKVKICKKSVRAHRIIFMMMTGDMPKIVDHINGIKDDNRWCNLREVTTSQNRMNAAVRSDNSSGHTGIHWFEKSLKWRVNVNRTFIGLYGDLNDAIEARNKARSYLQGDFARDNP